MSTVLNAQAKRKKVKEENLLKPMFDFYKKGHETIAINEKLLDKNQKGSFFLKANVNNKKFMKQKTGRFKGYPFRSFVGDAYKDGYLIIFPSIFI